MTVLNPTASALDVPPLDLFLAELAISSNVSRSAAKAGLTTAQVYLLRQRDPEFDRAWRAALCAGYEMLELAMLEHLAKGEIKGGKSAKGVRVVDVANGMRLLAAHRETVARERAIRDERDEDQVRASLNAKLNELRRRMGWDQGTAEQSETDDAA